LKQFLAKKENGSLKLDKFQQRLATALAPVELSKVANDEYVHFGDLLQFQSSHGAVLSNDVADKDPRGGEHSCAVTASSISSPCARNTFLIVKYDGGKFKAFDLQGKGDVLHYGQKFKIIANPMIVGEPLDRDGVEDPLYLRSMAVSTTNFAKFSRHQEVVLTNDAGFNTIWTVLCPDPAKRLVSEGSPVMAGAPVILCHAATNQYLCCEDKKYPNDFGTELEVSAHTTASLKVAFRLQGLIDGKPEHLSERPSYDSNVWHIVNGDNVKVLPAHQPSQFVVEKLLTKLLTNLNKQGSNGLAGLTKVFNELDTDGSKHLDLNEFKRALEQSLVHVTHDEAVKLLKVFDKDGSGSVDVVELVQTLEAYAARQ